MSDRTPHPGAPQPAETDADWEALARYLAGESSSAEAEATRRWIAARPERAAFVGALDRSLDRLPPSSSAAPAALDVERALGRVHARMDDTAPRVLPFRESART